MGRTKQLREASADLGIQASPMSEALTSPLLSGSLYLKRFQRHKLAPEGLGSLRKLAGKIHAYQ